MIAKIKLGIIVIFLLMLGLLGCGKPPVSVLPTYIKKIAINNFSNNIVQYGIEDKLTKKVIEEFLRDGRLEVVKAEEADALLTGVIVRYSLEPVSYDAQSVIEQYKLFIGVDVTFKDQVQGTIMWTESNIHEDYTYYVTAKAGQLVETENDAQEAVTDLLSRDIVKRTIIGWW
ncbi:MAG: LptE family protein [bacterium]|nr:LptE family protein [bacterium]MDD5353692.1 LptE family protein [bacterium]